MMEIGWKVEGRGCFLIICHLYSSPMWKWPADELKGIVLINKSWWHRDGFFVSIGRKCFPPGVNLIISENAVLLRQMGSGCNDNVFLRGWLCLWKMLVLEEDGLALFERQATGRGGQMFWYSSRGLAVWSHGCSLPSRGTFWWVAPMQLSGIGWEMASNEQRYAPQVMLLHLQMRRDRMWSD